MQRVLLLDELGEKFGAVHEYHNLRTPVDAIRLLCINYPEFAKHLIESGENGIGYRVVQAETDLNLEDMILPFGSRDLIITPVITGSGRGAGMIIAGIALIGLAVLMPSSVVAWKGAGFAAGAGKGLTAAAIAIGGNVGIALTLGGISQMLSPQPGQAPRFSMGSHSIDNGPGSITRGSDGRQSYAMTGAVNSVGVGATIPVAYGKTLIGSHLVSADIDVTDESDPVNTWFRTPGPSTIRVNGELLTFSYKEAGGLKSRQYNDDEFGKRNGSCQGSYWGGPCRNKDSPLEVPLDGTKKEISHIKGEFDEQFPAHRTLICIRLKNGLYKYVGGSEDSTKIDGYITFKVTVDNNDGYGRVGAVQFTVQGLLSETQTYQWASQFAYGKIAKRDNYIAYIEVTDYKLDSPLDTLEVVQLGYDYLPDT